MEKNLTKEIIPSQLSQIPEKWGQGVPINQVFGAFYNKRVLIMSSIKLLKAN